MNYESRTVEIEDDDILAVRFRNLSGNPDPYSKKNDRNFTVVLKDERAIELERQGFNIRWREFPDGNKEATLRVFARYDSFPPKIYKVTKDNMTLLNEETVGSIDNDEIIHLDLVLSPYHWEVNGNKGVKAYVKSAYFAIAEDKFSSRYDMSSGKLPF